MKKEQIAQKIVTFTTGGSRMLQHLFNTKGRHFGKKKYFFLVNKEEKSEIVSVHSIYFLCNKNRRTFKKDNVKFKSNYICVIV